MTTKTNFASLLLSLSFAASACTGTDGAASPPSARTEDKPAAGVPPQGSVPPAPPSSAPPSPTQPPPAGPGAPPAADVPEHPPALVGFWGSCDAHTFSTYLLRDDGSAVSGLSARPGYDCGGGAPLPPKSEPDQVCDCTWWVTGDSPSPSRSAPWLFVASCDGASGSIKIVGVDANSLTFEGQDGTPYTYSRLEESAPLADFETRPSNAQPARGHALRALSGLGLSSRRQARRMADRGAERASGRQSVLLAPPSELLAPAGPT